MERFLRSPSEVSKTAPSDADPSLEDYDGLTSEDFMDTPAPKFIHTRSKYVTGWLENGEIRFIFYRNLRLDGKAKAPRFELYKLFSPIIPLNQRISERKPNSFA